MHFPMLHFELDKPAVLLVGSRDIDAPDETTRDEVIEALTVGSPQWEIAGAGMIELEGSEGVVCFSISVQRDEMIQNQDKLMEIMSGPFRAAFMQNGVVVYCSSSWLIGWKSKREVVDLMRLDVDFSNGLLLV